MFMRYVNVMRGLSLDLLAPKTPAHHPAHVPRPASTPAVAQMATHLAGRP